VSVKCKKLDSRHFRYSQAQSCNHALFRTRTGDPLLTMEGSSMLPEGSSILPYSLILERGPRE
jgi:hypothetical protein